MDDESMEDPMEEIRKIFFVECDEHLEALQDGLEKLTEDPDDAATVDAVFRGVHSIKGGAAAFGLEELVGFSHEFETVLDALRSGRLILDNPVLDAMQQSADILSGLVSASAAGTPADEGAAAEGIARLVRLLTVQADPGEEAGEEVRESTPEPETPAAPGCWRVSFRPHPGLFERGNEPALILRELRGLGEARITCDTSDVPALEDLDPAASVLRWEILLETHLGAGDLREVFEFVEADCDLEIVPAVESSEVQEARPKDASPASVKPAVAPVAPLPPEQSGQAVAAPQVADQAARAATVRVNLERVDRLINLVGELVVNQAMLSQSVMESGLAGSSPLALGLDEFRNLTREVQESVLAIRAQPVKPLFRRVSRLMREAAAATGKHVRLESSGEMTEVDNTVIERLADPLTHMIRNAVDHGLESPKDREAAGKPREGVVRLSAEHRSGRVLIEVADDGAGIDRDRVLGIARDKGLVAANVVLSDSEIDNLLFTPGFSTASEVSDLSGRGVGMDVVKRSITTLGGRISISSEPGKGTTFSISLPLTLAILDGMVVKVAGQMMVVPLSAILEMMKPEQAVIHPFAGGGHLLRVRDAFVPVIDVAELLGFSPQPNGFDGMVLLLIETGDGEQRALLVEGIEDQRQVVIKGLEENYGAVPGIAAATILGDGSIALIIDPDAVVTMATQAARAPAGSLPMAG